MIDFLLHGAHMQLVWLYSEPFSTFNGLCAPQEERVGYINDININNVSFQFSRLIVS